LTKEEFREAIYDVVEALTCHPLSNSGRQLVIHYFNEIKEAVSYERAIQAILKYYPESLPEEESRPKSLVAALARLKKAADEWDVTE
jgi:hypothetical protein